MLKLYAVGDMGNEWGALAHPRRGGEAVCSPSPTAKLKKIDFVGTMISKVLHDLPIGLHQPLKSAND